MSESLRIVSKVQNPALLFNDTDSTTLTCLGANLVAGETAQHYWQKAESAGGEFLVPGYWSGMLALGNMFF